MAPGPWDRACLRTTGRAGEGWVWSGPPSPAPLMVGSAPLRPPCPLQRNPFSEGLPQEPLAARSDRPKSA